MTYALFKASWKPESPNEAVGGICGTAFFVGERVVLTAHHVCNSHTLTQPNPGYSCCRFWLLGRDGIIVPCRSPEVFDLPEIDTTVIKFNDQLPPVRVLKLSKEIVPVGTDVANQGHIESGDAKARLEWRDSELVVAGFDLKPFHKDGVGTVAEVAKANVVATDVKLNDVQIVRLSYGGTKGMSGGPLLLKDTDVVFGLMSFGLPPDSVIKKSLFAVSSYELTKRHVDSFQ